MYYGYKLKNQDGRPIYGEKTVEISHSTYTASAFAIQDAKIAADTFNMACPIIEIYSHAWMSDDWRLIEVLELKYVPQWTSKEPAIV